MEESVALKPCDLFKQKQNAEAFGQIAQSMQVFVGQACGNHRRNRASSELQGMLYAIGQKHGINIPHVLVSIFGVEINGTPCTAMEMVDGLTLSQIPREEKIPYDNDFVCRETWRQLLDILAGQIDRHIGNVMRRTKDGKVIAIDHDLSFPTISTRTFPDTLPKTLKAVDGLKTNSYCMPPVIDEEMRIVITNLDLDALEKMYRKCGLTKPQIKAAMARAKALKAEVEELRRAGSVIKPNEWESSPLVKQHCTPNNFYAGFPFDQKKDPGIT
jgi:hypothetical protein